jgi:hypothetical protein
MDRLGFWVFLLLALLIAAAYYVGVSTDFSAFSNGSRTILYALTGRNAQGEFAAYPGGATLQSGIAGN